MAYKWRSHPNVAPLEQNLAAARSEIVQLRHELQTKQTQVGGLELALHQRHQTIDALRGKLEAERAAKQRLDQENDRLVEMVQFSPK